MIIAIDGPAGAGKSTVARLVAARLGYAYLDTGALYRAAALQASRMGLALEEGEPIRRLMQEIEIRFEGGRTRLGGEDVSEAIRTPEISRLASVISAIPSVRRSLLPLQRRVGHAVPTVADGRDMGTVVFPDADHKFFLDATPAERARRRHRELRDKGVDVPLEEVEREIRERDERDSGRSEAPLRRAADAVYLLTDSMDVEEVVEAVLDRIGEAARPRPPKDVR